MLSRLISSIKNRFYANKQQEPKEPDIGQMSVYNAQSWAPDLHPNGAENSSLVKSIDYSDGNLDVEYRDGFKARYDATPQEAQNFSRADSKGRWARKNLWDRPYTSI